MKRYTPREIAEFISASGDFSDLSEDEIVTEIAEWDAHMEAGGYPVGREDPAESD